MKKALLFAILLVISAASFSQQIKSTPTLTKQDYLKKSKTQKTFAWILVGTGVGFVVAAVASTGVDDVANSIGGDNSGVNRGVTLFIIGGITTLSSIPLFLASHRNKKRGMSLSFKNEMAPQIHKGSFAYRSVPSLTLKIGL